MTLRGRGLAVALYINSSSSLKNVSKTEKQTNKHKQSYLCREGAGPPLPTVREERVHTPGLFPSALPKRSERPTEEEEQEEVMRRRREEEEELQIIRWP